MKYTIEDLSNGKCAVINDGTLEELREVLRLAFPEDEADLELWLKDHYEEKFFVQLGHHKEWGSRKETNLPSQSVKEFLNKTEMRKFKYIGPNSIFLKNGETYFYDKRIRNTPVSDLIKDFPNDFEEVIEPSLDDKIKELKELAKNQGMDCDVVLSENKRIEVEPTPSGILKAIELMDENGRKNFIPYLAKQIEKYLNQETE